MKSNVTVSFITINYNSSHHTIALLQSIVDRTTLDYEIIVVDNASQPEDHSALKTYCDSLPMVKLIKSRINTGFASGNMLGVHHACGEYYFFINNDCNL